MFKNKLLNISIIITITILFLGVSSFYLYQYIFPDVEAFDTEEKELPIDEILPLIVNVPKINTNLGDSSIIVIEMTLQTDNEKTKEEAEKRMDQLKDTIILFLKNLTKESFSTEEKIKQFKADLINRLNAILQEGTINKINITQLFTQ